MVGRGPPACMLDDVGSCTRYTGLVGESIFGSKLLKKLGDPGWCRNSTRGQESRRTGTRHPYQPCSCRLWSQPSSARGQSMWHPRKLRDTCSWSIQRSIKIRGMRVTWFHLNISAMNLELSPPVRGGIRLGKRRYSELQPSHILSRKNRMSGRQPSSQQAPEELMSMVLSTRRKWLSQTAKRITPIGGPSEWDVCRALSANSSVEVESADASTGGRAQGIGSARQT
jgi:hypothetical protein